MRRLLAPLLLLPLVGCASEPPSDASAEDFCAVFATLDEARGRDDFDRFAGRLGEVGTPADITESARAGFEVSVRLARSLEADATVADLEDADSSDVEEQQLQAFFEYGSETCESLDDDAGAL